MGINLKDTIEGTCRKAINDKDGNSIPETYLKKTGDSKDNTASFTSADSLTPAAWADVPVLATGEKHSSILNKISTMFRNIRWLYKMLGTTNIASIGGGTLTGAISKLNTDLQGKIFLTPMFMANEDGYLDCNDLPIGACAYAYPDTKNSPSRETGWKIFCYGAVWDYVAQIAVSYKGDKLAFRASWIENGAAIWGGWTILGK